jgi:hypothetical protein
MGPIMRTLVVLLVFLGWGAVGESLPARAQSCLPPTNPSTPTGGSPVKVIVHVPKPEVVVEDADTGTSYEATSEKHCFLKHKIKRPAPPPPQTIATIVAPTAALVPAPTSVVTTPVTTHPSCPSPGNTTAPDQAAMRAAQDLELTLADLAAARAAQKARMDASEAAFQRVTSSVMGLTAGAKASAVASPATDTPAPTLESLARNVQSLTERVEALDRLVRAHQQLLQDKFPEAFKQGP